MKFFGSPKRSCALWTTWGTVVALFFSSVRGVTWACGIFNGCRLATHTQRSVSRGCRHVLMPDVFCCRGVNSVFGDVRGVIADAFEGTRDQDQIEIPAQLLPVLHHPFGQFPV